MSTKHAAKLETTGTAFKRWRVMCGLNQMQAAELLGISRRQAQAYDTGVSPNTGKPISPPLTMRIAMQVYATTGSLPTPWPE